MKLLYYHLNISRYIKKKNYVEKKSRTLFLKHYFEKTKEQYKIRNKNNETITIQNQLKKSNLIKTLKKPRRKKAAIA